MDVDVREIVQTSRGEHTLISRKYTGSFDCIRKIIATEGLQGVYAGYGISLLGQ